MQTCMHSLHAHTNAHVPTLGNAHSHIYCHKETCSYGRAHTHAHMDRLGRDGKRTQVLVSHTLLFLTGAELGHGVDHTENSTAGPEPGTGSAEPEATQSDQVCPLLYPLVYWGEWVLFNISQ